jgi:hypothetical protein
MFCPANHRWLPKKVANEAGVGRLSRFPVAAITLSGQRDDAISTRTLACAPSPRRCRRRYIRAVIHCGAIEYRLNQNKGLAILITRGVNQFVVGSRELPAEEPEEGAPAGFFVRGKTRWGKGLDCGWIGPVFDRDAIAGIMPRRQCRRRGFSAGG